jgi:peptidoglycan/LPS O-acetylase OafA/YrhL
MQPTHKYLSNLTPLRGIAAIWVVVYHFSEIVAKFVSAGTTHFLSKGYLMVDLFFIMSGFIISHVYERSFQNNIQSIPFRRYIVARFARIYPLHLFTLLLLIFLATIGGSWNPVQDPAAIPTNILLLHSFGIHKIFTWNVPSWSISAEWWAYMVFPFLVIFLNQNKRLAIAILGLFVVLSYIAIMFWLTRKNPFDSTISIPHNLDTTFDYGYLRGLAGFVSGMILYKVYDSGIFRSLFQKDVTAILVILICIICMHLGVNDGFEILMFVALVFAFALNKEKLHVICNNPVAQYLGKISYSIYLIHIFPLIPVFAGLKLPGLVYANHSATTNFLTGAGYCFIYVCAVIGLSSLSYYGIEKPCRKWINARWGKETMPVYA